MITHAFNSRCASRLFARQPQRNICRLSPLSAKPSDAIYRHCHSPITAKVLPSTTSNTTISKRSNTSIPRTVQLQKIDEKQRSDANAAPEDQVNKDQVPAYDLTFTCKKCLSRSTHRVSKQGFYKGTVLITCPGCKNRHLISDHLKVGSLYGLSVVHTIHYVASSRPNSSLK